MSAHPNFGLGGEWICEDCDHRWEADVPKTAADSAQNRLKLKIFLSYGHDQHAVDAERIKQDLQQRGHEFGSIRSG